MRKMPLWLGIACGLAFPLPVAAQDDLQGTDLFHPPVRVAGGGEPVKVDPPGWAAPCLADWNGDGKPDLLVGQFKKGYIRVYPGDGKGQFGKGEFLKAGDKVAEVPGVW